MVPQTSKYSDVFVLLTLKLQYQKMTIRVVASITSNTEIHFIFYLDCFPASSFCDWVCFIPFCSSSVSYMSVIRLLLYVSKSVSKYKSVLTYLIDYPILIAIPTLLFLDWLPQYPQRKSLSTIIFFLRIFWNCILSYFYSVEHVRYCDSCDTSREVCVALTEDIPVCHKIQDPLDPTGCGGLCILNSQVCLRIDTDAFKYVILLNTVLSWKR